jgi:23S rRNA (uridine2479-2'-O)-methyltransferase
MGSLFALPTVRLPSHVEVGQWVRALELPPAPGPTGASHRDRGAVQIVGTSGRAARAVDAVDLTGPTVLVLGNEAEGLTPGYQDLCDLLVGVPMQAGADSVNVACAAAIVLYEADRQRRSRPPARAPRGASNTRTPFPGGRRRAAHGRR